MFHTTNIAFFEKISSGSRYSIINIDTPSYVIGGLVGVQNNYNGNSIIYNSSANVKIFGNYIYDTYHHNSHIGGFVGWNCGKIINSFSNVDIHIYSDDPYYGYGIYSTVGGFIGESFEGIIDNCYSSGIIKAVKNGHPTGGFIGSYVYDTPASGIISNSYTSVALVDTESHDLFETKGGFIGYVDLNVGFENDTTFTIKGCYWNVDNCNEEGIGGIDEAIKNYDIEPTGLSSEQMRQQASFKDWDFENVWKIDEGKGYPELRGVANNFIQIPDTPINPKPEKPDPVDPDPVEPDPVDPTPVDPTPSEPDPVTPPDTVDPDPVEPEPVVPTPSYPDPTPPAPVQPGQVEPDPVTPPAQPVTPNPVQPTPSEPDVSPSQPEPSNPDSVPGNNPGQDNSGNNSATGEVGAGLADAALQAALNAMKAQPVKDHDTVIVYLDGEPDDTVHIIGGGPEKKKDPLPDVRSCLH